jgi:uncharacterized protein (DUF697 family)
MATDATGSGKAASTDQPLAHEGAASGAAATTPEQREEMATKLVERFALWSGAAGLIPIPFVDVVTVGGLQLQLLRRLSEIYDVPFSVNRGKSIIASLMGAMIPATSSIGVGSVLKTLPVIGTAAGAVTMSGVSAGATYAIGKVFIQHFASGGSLLDFEPPDYREFIKAQKEKWSSRSGGSSAAREADRSGDGGSGKAA